MHDDIVYDKHRSFYETPIEIDIIHGCARAPAVAIIDNFDLIYYNPESLSMVLRARGNLFASSTNIPIAQVYFPFCAT